ncbi:MAG: DNA repair protein RadC [Pelagibaca sp.]
MTRSRSPQLSLFETAAVAPASPAKPKPVAPAKPKQPSYIGGHRKRLRARFLVGGAEPLPDYELLELVLFRCLRNGDVKPLANRLIETFGDFNRVLSASIERLTEVEGIGPEIALDLKLIEAATHRMSQGRVLKRPVISSWNALLDYCRVTMSHRETEVFRILFLDRKNVLIADEIQGKGTVDHVPVYPREVIKRALDLNASALILVHNHPSGDPTPSTADIAMTEDILRACEVVGVTVHDHLIIGKLREVSFKSEGYL